ncbi:hypothetical protein A5730_23175 [Mycobacterium sp. ACS4054]|uniref:HNH endonuclease signature motif containing protein n=1 Tax=Mycobacterium sp. ACS4054 TaxID=1834119 RepID=UPI0007FECBE4|nr:HNH endonuclease signature motif containing protein [Mycobacterium sp. ACS4054]OBF02891.1 hypothetical protein A5730_23175 [Mycobacterium sp. ACS4054]
MSVDPEALSAAFAVINAAVDDLIGSDCDALATGEQLAMLEHCESLRRRLPAIEHPLINSLAHKATGEELGGTLAHAIAEAALISRAEASRRVREAVELGPRHGLTGEPIEPILPATAAAQRAGTLGGGQVAVIRRFFHQLPAAVDAPTREAVEAELVAAGSQFRPEQLASLADHLADCLNPDGRFTDTDRARRRGLTLGRQGPDGMSELRGLLTPEARATVEAVLAKLAAPGMCNPLEDTPCVDGSPTQEAIDRDARSTAQRSHDALLAANRALLASGKLGQHNGLPASIVITTTLQDLEAATGTSRTGGGTRLPISDVIRLARHAHHYLAVFDHAKPVALYHTKRLASPGQRIMLYAKDRGCSAPGCTVPGYLSEVHHVTDYAKRRRTDIDDLTFACGPHHRLLKPGGWRARKNAKGDTEWIPPPRLERGQPRSNTFHHPERLLRKDDDDDDAA